MVRPFGQGPVAYLLPGANQSRPIGMGGGKLGEHGGKRGERRVVQKLDSVERTDPGVQRHGTAGGCG